MADFENHNHNNIHNNQEKFIPNTREVKLTYDIVIEVGRICFCLFVIENNVMLHLKDKDIPDFYNEKCCKTISFCGGANKIVKYYNVRVYYRIPNIYIFITNNISLSGKHGIMVLCKKFELHKYYCRWKEKLKLQDNKMSF